MELAAGGGELASTRGQRRRAAQRGGATGEGGASQPQLPLTLLPPSPPPLPSSSIRYDDDGDEELLKLIPFLERVAGAEDVRPHIQARPARLCCCCSTVAATLHDGCCCLLPSLLPALQRRLTRASPPASLPLVQKRYRLRSLVEAAADPDQQYLQYHQAAAGAMGGALVEPESDAEGTPPRPEQ